jgi:hypothetical protein
MWLKFVLTGRMALISRGGVRKIELSVHPWENKCTFQALFYQHATSHTRHCTWLASRKWSIFFFLRSARDVSFATKALVGSTCREKTLYKTWQSHLSVLWGTHYCPAEHLASTKSVYYMFLPSQKKYYSLQLKTESNVEMKNWVWEIKSCWVLISHLHKTPQVVPYSSL